MAIGTDLLTALADADGPLAVAALAAVTGREAHAVSRALCAMANQDMVERLAIGHYRITADGRLALDHGGQRPGPKRDHAGACTPRSGTVRERIWAALRLRGKATLTELAILAGRGPDAYENCKRYLKALERSGYIARLPRRRGHQMNVRGVVLIDDTGPLAPIVQQAKGRCYDRNRDEPRPFAPTATATDQETDHEPA